VQVRQSNAAGTTSDANSSFQAFTVVTTTPAELPAPTLKLANGSLTSSGDWSVFAKQGAVAVVKVEGLDEGDSYSYSIDNGQTWIDGEGDSFNIASLDPSRRWSLIAKKRDQTGILSPASAILNFSFFQIQAISTETESFKVSPLTPTASETIQRSASPAAKIQTFTLDYEIGVVPIKGQSEIILDKMILPDKTGGYGVGFYGIDPSSSTVSYSLTFDPSKRGGATAYDLDGDGKADQVLLRLVDGGIGDWDAKSGAIKGSITAAWEAINPVFNFKGSQDLQVVDPSNPNANVGLNITARLASRATTVNEVGFVVVEPGIPITLDLIRRSGNVLFSGLESSDVPDISSLDLASKLSLRNGQTLRFYETVDTSFADLSRGKSNLSELGSAFRFLDVSLDAINGSAKVNSASGLSFDLRLTPATPGLSDLIADRQTEAPVLDFTFNSQAGRMLVADWALRREAFYDSVLSFYRILNVEGTVQDPLTGALVNPGDPGYKDAAYRNRVDQISGLTTGNIQSNGAQVSLQESSLVAPVATVTTPKFENTFFAFAAANTDKLGHFRRLSDNIFGFEDQNGGGDLDFDDLIFAFKPIGLG